MPSRGIRSRRSKSHVAGDLERIRKHLDDRRCCVEVDRDDVEPTGTIGQMMPHHVIDGEPRHLALLPGRYGFARLAEFAALARFDLDEHDRRSVARDDVQFSTPTAVPPVKNFVPAPFQLTTREIFACFSEGASFAGHALSTAIKTSARVETRGRKEPRNHHPITPRVRPPPAPR